MTEDEIATGIVDAALSVHRTLGPGLLESVYEAALAFELGDRGFEVQRHGEPLEVRRPSWGPGRLRRLDAPPPQTVRDPLARAWNRLDRALDDVIAEARLVA